VGAGRGSWWSCGCARGYKGEATAGTKRFRVSVASVQRKEVAAGRFIWPIDQSNGPSSGPAVAFSTSQLTTDFTARSIEACRITPAGVLHEIGTVRWEIDHTTISGGGFGLPAGAVQYISQSGCVIAKPAVHPHPGITPHQARCII
jgi:hypothetical protein